MRKLFFISGCFILIASCTKEATVKLPDTKPLPVMCSYICPDDTVIRLKLTYSSPLYSSNQVDIMEAVPDADVRISGDQGTAQLIFNQATKYYELKTNVYPVVAGQFYKMTVSTSKGDVATAETQVPVTVVPITNVTLETITENAGKRDYITASFTDEPGKVNYYRMVALYAFTNVFLPDTFRGDAHINEFYSDANNDGENISIVGRSYQSGDSTKFYDVFLFNCSVSYYSFHKSLRNDSGISFPPAGEPTLMYSNVKGGFGCFGAYTRSRFRYWK